MIFAISIIIFAVAAPLGAWAVNLYFNIKENNKAQIEDDKQKFKDMTGSIVFTAIVLILCFFITLWAEYKL